MNIYANNGHKVRVKTFNAGYDYQQEIAKKHLKIGKEYTVEGYYIRSLNQIVNYCLIYGIILVPSI